MFGELNTSPQSHYAVLSLVFNDLHSLQTALNFRSHLMIPYNVLTIRECFKNSEGKPS
jgi:hypothetical protein